MALFPGRKSSEVSEVYDPNPEVISTMPARPYRVLYADLAFYSDPECKKPVDGARLVVLRSEDPKQQHQVQECMPARKMYGIGQIVEWDLNNKRIWQNNWYINPETGKAEMAWVQAAEFTGRVVEIK
jgi:hypothetical protein